MTFNKNLLEKNKSKENHADQFHPVTDESSSSMSRPDRILPGGEHLSIASDTSDYIDLSVNSFSVVSIPSDSSHHHVGPSSNQVSAVDGFSVISFAEEEDNESYSMIAPPLLAASKDDDDEVFVCADDFSSVSGWDVVSEVSTVFSIDDETFSTVFSIDETFCKTFRTYKQVLMMGIHRDGDGISKEESNAETVKESYTTLTRLPDISETDVLLADVGPSCCDSDKVVQNPLATKYDSIRQRLKRKSRFRSFSRTLQERLKSM
jgi:hypothetical protein